MREASDFHIARASSYFLKIEFTKLFFTDFTDFTDREGAKPSVL